jgi:hypothetical protein
VFGSDAPRRGSSGRPPNPSWPRRRGLKHPFRPHAPLSDCSGSRRCRLLRRRVCSREGRPKPRLQSLGRATLPAAPLTRSCGRRPQRRTASRLSWPIFSSPRLEARYVRALRGPIAPSGPPSAFAFAAVASSLPTAPDPAKRMKQQNHPASEQEGRHRPAEARSPPACLPANVHQLPRPLLHRPDRRRQQARPIGRMPTRRRQYRRRNPHRATGRRELHERT